MCVVCVGGVGVYGCVGEVGVYGCVGGVGVVTRVYLYQCIDFLSRFMYT